MGTFLGAIKPLKLNIQRPQNSLVETQQWLKDGGVLSAIKWVYFLEEHNALWELKSIDDMLSKVHYSPTLTSKLTAHLQRMEREELIPYIQYSTKL
ncbi:hypothetical protein [Clostridium sp. CCUG 7971]|uniref:hypothetical protein n=1 Tax=Clostridium sp. CCUG 7971 TaxID=2811414 RepID=UPI001ABB1BE2|nr:hypothetical protein [Clostridium sp. CCUG 7971]MBO3443853.1 hypothetical protein [Clostridium sp. CCUG 7971]